MKESAFNVEIEAVRDQLFGLAMKFTKNRVDAEDLLQETFTRAYAKRETFETGSNFKAWTSTILYNQFVNNYRKIKTRNEVDTPVEENHEVMSMHNGLEDADSTIFVEDLQAIIEALHDHLKIPFLMSYEGYQYDEIAARLGLPIGTVKSRVFYARKALRHKIEQRYGKHFRSQSP